VSKTDARGALADGSPFEYRITSGGAAIVFWGGRIVATLPAREASALAAIASKGDAMAVQLFLAKATGNFKRGNER